MAVFLMLIAVLGLADLAHAGSVHVRRPGVINALLFADIPEASSVMAVGDFNGDGVADLVEAGSEDAPTGAGALTVLLGRADGTFRPVISRNLFSGDPRALVAGDFNGDGKLDVIVGDSGGNLVEIHGDGKGNLTNPEKIGSAGSIVSIAVGQFTHDGKLDLAVSDLESNAVEIFLGSGDGSFRQTWAFALPQRGREYHLAAPDFNRDGISDVVITSEDDENYEVMLGNGNGTFTYAPKLSHLKDPNSYCPT